MHKVSHRRWVFSRTLFICRRNLPFILFPRLFPVIYRSYINYYSRIKRFSLFNHKCTKRRARRARARHRECPPPRYPFVLVRILSAMIAQYPRRINWSHLALAINLARVRRASGGIHAHASQRGAMLLSAFLLIAGCRQRYPPPRFWCGRTSEWRSLTERESLRFSIYWSVTNAREFRLGARLELSSSLGMGSSWYIYSRFVRFNLMYSYHFI